MTTDRDRDIGDDFKSSDKDKRSQLEKLHAHWRSKFSKDLREKLIDKGEANVGAAVLIAPEDQSDKALGFHYHDMDKSEKTKNFDQKIYMFPPAFNALREELHNHWPHLWEVTSWYMANRPEEFCGIMNAATELRVIFDSGAVNWMCDQWLRKLQKMRIERMPRIILE